MKNLSTIHYVVFLLIITSATMHYVYYSNTGNFNSPIIDYEFVKNTNDVKNILMQDNEFKKDVIQGVHDQNVVDYVYMLIYTAFLYLVFAKIKRFKNKNIFILGGIFAFLALISDLIENIQLFSISELFISRVDFLQNIKVLIVATNVKWFSLAMALFILAFHYFKNGFAGKLFALVSSLPLVLGIAYVVLQSVEIRQYYTLLIMIGFVFLMVWVFVSKYINNEISFYK